MVRVLKPGGKLAIFDLFRTGEYAEVLRASGAKDVELSKTSFLWCVPGRSLTAQKVAVDVVHVTKILTSADVESAYRAGIFPMADSDRGIITWHRPKRRAILPLDDISRLALAARVAQTAPVRDYFRPRVRRRRGCLCGPPQHVDQQRN